MKPRYAGPFLALAALASAASAQEKPSQSFDEWKKEQLSQYGPWHLEHTTLDQNVDIIELLDFKQRDGLYNNRTNTLKTGRSRETLAHELAHTWEDPNEGAFYSLHYSGPNQQERIEFFRELRKHPAYAQLDNEISNYESIAGRLPVFIADLQTTNKRLTREITNIQNVNAYIAQLTKLSSEEKKRFHDRLVDLYNPIRELSLRYNGLDHAVKEDLQNMAEFARDFESHSTELEGIRSSIDTQPAGLLPILDEASSLQYLASDEDYISLLQALGRLLPDIVDGEYPTLDEVLNDPSMSRELVETTMARERMVFDREMDVYNEQDIREIVTDTSYMRFDEVNRLMAEFKEVDDRMSLINFDGSHSGYHRSWTETAARVFASIVCLETKVDETYGFVNKDVLEFFGRMNWKGKPMFGKEIGRYETFLTRVAAGEDEQAVRDELLQTPGSSKR